ncbi:alkyl hydroperoxide reductase [Paractinoplanes deccanensis]|uniref:Alkyl hydroperoxide reductase n=1 Tax=Paractinoplanes deccanensis TaxID=113561 RepID=A0ABQ3YDB9_9ACTN|nr:peroxiredoxin-like family protein [Actinoplanes deccanensis]GID78009.1 alkyl hydroperoxide reductase [Actinoplanes deccanensis]
MRELIAADGAVVPVPDPERLVHLQFRRFAGCPICNLHLQSIVRRHAEIEAAGIREVVVFHSPAEELREYDLPFAVIPDPQKRLYIEYGVQASPRALAHPRAWWPLVRSLARGTVMIVRGREAAPAGTQPHGRLGLPADFLIAPDGRTVASKFGKHAYDQWSVDDLLARSGNWLRMGGYR